MDPHDAGLAITYRSSRGKWVLAASILGSGMAFLDSTAVNVALPAIGREFGASFAEFQWVINGYLLALGSLVLVGGSLGDLYGRRRIFLIGLVWFAIASLLCGVAWNTTSLIVFRVIQGVGAALLVPTSLAMLQSVFVPSDRAPAIGVWSGFSGVWFVMGPLLGGWLIDTISWRTVFLINPLVAAITVVMAIRFVPETRGDETIGRPDVAGGVAAAAMLGGLVYALIEGPVRGWDDATVAVAAVVALVGLVLFATIETRSSHPMMPLDIYRSRQFSGANLYTLAVYFVLSGSFFLLTLQLQNVLGYTALEAGAAAAPTFLLLWVLSPAAGRLANRIGPRIPMMLGPVVCAISLLMLSAVDVGTSYLSGIFPATVVFGIGLSLLVAPLTATVLAAVPERQAGLASGINNAVARTAGLLAVALLPLAAGLSGIATVGGGEFSEGYSKAMWISAVLIVVGTVIAAVTIRERLTEGSHSQARPQVD